MTAADTKRPALQGVARVIPWKNMTPEQQGEHVRVMHGWDDTFCAKTSVHNLDHAGYDDDEHATPHTHDKETP